MSDIGYLVLGGVTGQVGRALTVFLARSGAPVAASLRLGQRHHYQLKERIDLAWLSPEGAQTWIATNIPVIIDPSQLDQTRRWVIVLAVRSYQIERAIQPYLACQNRLAGFVVPTNGLESEAKVRKLFPNLPIVSMTLTYPCEASPENKRCVQVRNTAGGIGLAQVTDNAHFLTQALAETLRHVPELAVTVYPNWEEMKWTKCLINTIGNILPATLQMDLAAMYAHQSACRLELEMIGEILQLMDLQSIKVIDLPGYPKKKLVPLLTLATAAYQFSWTRHVAAWAYQRYLVPKILTSRGGKVPSLLQEIRQGARECENLLADIVTITRAKKLLSPLIAYLADTLQRRFAGDTEAARLVGSPDQLYGACHLSLK